MSARRTRPLLLVALLALATAGCAWTDRANRPVWNAFEGSLVPEDETLQWVTAPVTVPLGIVAILLDLFVAHPIQVMDDAWGASSDDWRDVDWRGHYYSQTAYTLVRVPLTALHLVFSFLGRSLFDIEPWESREDRGERLLSEALLEAEQRTAHARLLDASSAEILAWLERLPSDAEAEAPGRFLHELAPLWTPAHAAAAARVLAGDDALARLRARHLLLRVAPPPYDADPSPLLADRDPRVRLALLLDLGPIARAWPPDVQPRLAGILWDEDPIVRQAAREVLGRARVP